ncbi:MAG: histidine-type phosphatase [Desulfovibrionales bacterium]|nr:histidine-type phosphatase [Desulfovibrionales bacterium]
MSDKHIKKIVIIMRHGVRAPNQTPEKLKEWSLRTWPEWPVKPGYLTNRGRELITVLWRILRNEHPYYQLLFEDGRCVAAEDIFIHADIDERTQASAAVFAEALAPECPISYYITSDKTLDPVYHPIRGTICKFTRDESEDELIDLVGDSFNELAKEFSSQLDFVTDLLGPMPVLTCKEYGVGANCVLKDLPPRINFANSGRTVNVRGALGIKATLIQNWLLEAAQWPNKTPGWGALTRDKLEELLVARAAIFNCLNRADGYSRDRGSAILKSVCDALSGTHEDSRVNDARLVMYMGHDTNMAHISDLLGLEWDLDTYTVNDIPPGSFLQFSLWEDSLKRKSVSAEFVAQPLDVLLSDKPELAEPAYVLKKLQFVPREPSELSEVFPEYALDTFRAVVDKMVNFDCIPPMGSLILGRKQ